MTSQEPAVRQLVDELANSLQSAVLIAERLEQQAAVLPVDLSEVVKGLRHATAALNAVCPANHRSRRREPSDVRPFRDDLNLRPVELTTTDRPLPGLLHFWSETGTEGGYWAFQDERFIDASSRDWPFGRWRYEGLWVLKDGDELTIFDKFNPAQEVWRGAIRLREHPLFTESIGGLWIHADQEGLPRDMWAKWFMSGYPAEYWPKPGQHPDHDRTATKDDHALISVCTLIPRVSRSATLKHS